MDVDIPRSNISIISCLLVLSTLGAMNIAPDSDTTTSLNCARHKQNATTLKNCHYRWPTVTCEIVTMATSNQTLTHVDLKQYLRLTLQFRILGSLYENVSNISKFDNTSEADALQCLSLEKMTIAKVKERYSNTEKDVSFETISLPILIQMAGLEEINIQFTFTPNNTKKMASAVVTNRSSTVDVEMDYPINFTKEGFYNASLRNMLEKKFKEFSEIQGTITKIHLVQSGSIVINKIWENIWCNDCRELKVNGGRWTRLEKKQLPTMFSLKVLDLSDNEIHAIEDDFFELSPNLEALSLSNNKLKKLPSSIGSLENLKILDISENPSLDIKNGNGELRNLTKLQWLNISNTPLKNLYHLKIHYDKRNFSNLLGLRLRKCNLIITENNVEFFDHMIFLSELDLSENQLSSLPADIFSSLKNLRVLKLASNRFTQNLNLNLHHLTNLDLSTNKIVDVNQLKIEAKIDYINLSNNAISSWGSVNSFSSGEDSYTIRAKHLNLSYNSITSISEAMKKLFSTFTSVDLGGNPLDCTSCNIPLLQRWLLENRTTTVFNLGEVENLKCGDLENNLRYVTDVNFNEMLCLQDEYDIDYALVVGVPLLVLAALVLLSVIAVYGYRYEITYIRHLVNIRRQRHLKEGSTERYKYDAFVSYSAADRDWVMKELQPHLEQGAERYRLCLHERDFALGSIIADNIVECMKDSRNTLVILTPHFVKSQWCRWELEVANHKLFEDDREFLILIELKKLDKKTLPRHLAYLVDTRTYLEWPKGYGPHPRAWARLKSALGESLYQRRTKQRAKTNNFEQDREDV